MKRVFANRRDWRSYLSHIECGYTLHYAARSQAGAPRFAGVEFGEGEGGGGGRESPRPEAPAREQSPLSPRLEAVMAVFAENRRQ